MKVLIAVASKHGATAEIADQIGQTLERHGLDCRLQRCEEVLVISDYDGVIVGSAVYAGHWRPEAVEFVDRLADELASKPTWLFSSGPLGDPPKPPEDPTEVEELAARVRARDHALFAGKLDKTKLSLAERGVVRMVKAPYGDFRPWNQIGAWAEEIASSLAPRVHIPVLGPDDGRLPHRSDHELRPD